MEVIEKLLNTKMSFFEETDNGQILVRFSKDQVVIDILIFPLIVIVVHGFFFAIAFSISIIIINPYTLSVFVMSVATMFFLLKYTIRVLEESQRLESVLRTPTHHTLVSKIHGLVSYRSFSNKSILRQNFIENVEKAANASFCFIISNRWLAFRLDFVGLFFTISVAVFSLIFKYQITTALLGYTLQITSNLLGFFSFTLRSYAELQNFMTSVQRLIRYTKLENEG